MDRAAVFVDAGYLFASGSILLFGSKLPRRELQLDHAGLTRVLQDFATTVSEIPLLRIYWYDGTSTLGRGVAEIAEREGAQYDWRRSNASGHEAIIPLRVRPTVVQIGRRAS